MRNARRWLAGAACVIAVAACSSEPETTAPTLELSTTTITTLPPTTVTTEAPTTTIDPRIAEVEAAVAEYRRVFVEVLTDSDAPVESLEAVAGGDLLGVIVENVLKERASSDTTSGTFGIEPVDTTIFEDGSASHLSCGLDALEGYDASGELIVPADELPFLRRYSLQRSEGSTSWIVVGIVFEGPEKTPCAFVS